MLSIKRFQSIPIPMANPTSASFHGEVSQSLTGTSASFHGEASYSLTGTSASFHGEASHSLTGSSTMHHGEGTMNHFMGKQATL